MCHDVLEYEINDDNTYGQQSDNNVYGIGGFAHYFATELLSYEHRFHCVSNFFQLGQNQVLKHFAVGSAAHINKQKN